MSVVTLPTTAAFRWDTALARISDAVEKTSDPRLALHLATAQAMAASGLSPRWADRIAAIQVLAERRADLAVTPAGRVRYLAAADAAEVLLFEAERVHGLVPSQAAQDAIAALAQADVEEA